MVSRAAWARYSGRIWAFGKGDGMSLLICLTVNRALLDALEQALGDEYRVRVIDDPAGLAACMASPDDNDNASRRPVN